MRSYAKNSGQSHHISMLHLDKVNHMKRETQTPFENEEKYQIKYNMLD